MPGSFPRTTVEGFPTTSGGMGSKSSIWPGRCIEDPLSCFVLKADRLNAKVFAFAFSFYVEVADIKLQLLASLFKD